ncbi:MAG: PilN domain-containing protein [Planctomycetota bacterium]
MFACRSTAAGSNAWQTAHKRPEAASASVALAVPADVVLYRKLDLPAADQDATLQMVESQLQSQFPEGQGRLRAGWARANSGVHAVGIKDSVAAASTQAIDEVTFLVPAGIAAAALVSDVVLSEEPMTVVCVEPIATTIATITPHGLATIQVVDLGSDDLTDADACQRWVRETGEVATHSRTVMVGKAPEHATTSLARILADEPTALTDVDASLPEGLAAQLAAGAAIAAAQPDWPVIRLAAPRTQHQSVIPRPWWPAVAMLVCIFITATATVLADLSRADRQAAAINDAEIQGTAVTALNDRLQLMRFLEQRGPLPLAILDELVHLTPRGMPFKGISYAADGRVNISGEVDDARELAGLIEALNKAKTLDNVELKSQKQSNRRISFEIVASTSDRFTGAFAVADQSADAGTQPTPGPALAHRPGSRRP